MVMNGAKISHETAINELLRADGDVYSWNFIDLFVPIRSKKKIAICSACGESFVQDENEIICKWCSDPENL
jgi:formylmethanofuran dehydrogenase subunit E